MIINQSIYKLFNYLIENLMSGLNLDLGYSLLIREFVDNFINAMKE